jgi:hypothetical protein
MKMVSIVLIVLLWMTGYVPSSAQESDQDTFRLIVLTEDWWDLQLGYTYETALPNLEDADLSDPLFVIDMNQIESYDWTRQAITLTEEASSLLIDALPLTAEQRDGVRELTQLKESLGWGNPVENALYIHGFVVQVDGEFLYGGIFLDPMSQMAIDYPVIRSEIVDGKVIFHLLPIHIPFVTYDPVPSESTTWDEAIADEMMGDWGQFSNDTKAALMGFADSADARSFRQLIRDPHLYDILMAANKWNE